MAKFDITCMLHIFFSSRFVAIVDRLWMHAGSRFYVKLYVYFVCTSAVLAMSFLPFIGRTMKRNLLRIFMNETKMNFLSPLWDIISLCNLCQYAVSSTTVIIIFWRTNYRMYTVAERKDSTNIPSTDDFVPLRGDDPQQVFNLDVPVDGDIFDHPIYHGRWH